MVSRQEKKLLHQLAGLRDNRLQMAEFRLAKARRAEEEAIKAVEAMKKALIGTRAWSRTALAAANSDLWDRGAIAREAIEKWKRRRDRIRARLAEAQERLEKAKAERIERERQMQEARGKHRDAVMAIERLKLLRAELK
jgi:hypothetical protein